MVDVALVIVFGVAAAVAAALGRFTVITSRVERQNGTDRNRNGEEGPQDLLLQQGLGRARGGRATSTLYSYNYCWPVRTLRVRSGDGGGGRRRWTDRTPAMSAGLTDHVWTLAEWLSWPAVRHAV